MQSLIEKYNRNVNDIMHKKIEKSIDKAIDDVPSIGVMSIKDFTILVEDTISTDLGTDLMVSNIRLDGKSLRITIKLLNEDAEGVIDLYYISEISISRGVF